MGAGGGEGGVAGQRGALRQRLLLTRTRALLAQLASPPLAQLGPEPSSPGPALRALPASCLAVSSEDLADAAAAEALFRRLLTAAMEAAGPELGLPAASGGTLERLRLLARLLRDVWRDGGAWADTAQGEGAGGAGPGAEAAGQGPAVSGLRGCWRALAEALLRSGHAMEVLR